MPRHSAYVNIDPETGVEKIFHRHHDGDWTYETRQDLQPIFDANKEAQNHVSTWNAARDTKLVARVPSIFIQKLYDEHGIEYFNPDHQAWVDRWLDDPENRWMRTDDSVLSKRRVSKARIEQRIAARKLFEEV